MKRLRLAVQLLFTIVTNGYMYGFLTGKIYRGGLKYACVPGLNCYSCPGAVAACPIGALQSLLNQRGFQIPFAALGFFFLFGSLLGRFVCGWLCPFGLVQDLLHKIPIFKKKKNLPCHHILKYGKYAVLILLVCVGSMFLFGGFAKVPAFCKYLCPSGTLFGAIPLLSTNEALRGQAGGLFLWKLGILIGVALLSVKVYRPFCQYLCPLGAIYGRFNRFSLVQIQRTCVSLVWPAKKPVQWTSLCKKFPSPQSAYGAENAWMPARRSACIFVSQGRTQLRVDQRAFFMGKYKQGCRFRSREVSSSC